MSIMSINFYTVTNTALAPWTYNAFSQSQLGAGTLSSDLLDDDNVSTGYTLSVINAFTAASGGVSTAGAGVGSFPNEVLDTYWYTGAAESPSKIRIGNLTDGDNYTIEAIGHQGTTADRDTDFTVNGTTSRYDNSGTATPNSTISFSGTVSGTTLDIDMALVSVFGYVNGYKITITPPPSRSITNIDGDNNVKAGQTNVTVTTVGMDASPTISTATLGGESLTVVSAGATSWTVSMPLHIDLEWGSTTNDLVLTDDTGSVTLTGVTFLAPDGWETVTFSGTIPNTSDTDSFYEEAIADLSYTMLAGDILAFESSTGLSVDTNTYVVVDPASTVTGGYKIWSDALQSWTSASSYTWTDGGDIAKPVITLNGNASIVWVQGNVWVDPQATVTDNVDATRQINADSAPNINTPDVYTLNYNATDAAGNVADTVTLTVTVSGADSTPNQFTFTDVSNAELNTLYENTQQITGVDVGQTLTATNGTLSNDGGSTWFSSVQFVSGQTYVKASLTTDGTYSDPFRVSPSVNGITDTFDVTTKAEVTRTFTIGSSDAVVDSNGDNVTYTFPIWELWDKIPEDTTAVKVDSGVNFSVSNGVGSVQTSSGQLATNYIFIARNSGNTPANYIRTVGQVQ